MCFTVTRRFQFQCHASVYGFRMVSLKNANKPCGVQCVTLTLHINSQKAVCVAVCVSWCYLTRLSAIFIPAASSCTSLPNRCVLSCVDLTLASVFVTFVMFVTFVTFVTTRRFQDQAKGTYPDSV